MHKLIASALYRQGDIIYIGTPVDGLYSYSIPQKKLEKITPITETKQIQAILQQSPTRIWVATEGAGLLLLNPKTKEVKAYHHSSSNPKKYQFQLYPLSGTGFAKPLMDRNVQ